MGLVEASQGKIGNAVDQVLLYCYHYDPATGKYGAVVSNILRLGGSLTIVIVGSLLLILFRLEKSAPRRSTWDHADVGQAKSGPATSDQARLDQARLDQARLDQARPDQARYVR
jgi:hypothetical protein